MNIYRLKRNKKKIKFLKRRQKHLILYNRDPRNSDLCKRRWKSVEILTIEIHILQLQIKPGIFDLLTFVLKQLKSGLHQWNSSVEYEKILGAVSNDKQGAFTTAKLPISDIHLSGWVLPAKRNAIVDSWDTSVVKWYSMHTISLQFR